MARISSLYIYVYNKKEMIDIIQTNRDIFSYL